MKGVGHAMATVSPKANPSSGSCGPDPSDPHSGDYPVERSVPLNAMSTGPVGATASVSQHMGRWAKGNAVPHRAHMIPPAYPTDTYPPRYPTP